MWPKKVVWNSLKFGVEIEFVEGSPENVELLPGWTMALDETHIDDSGEKSGAELQSPPLSWDARDDIRISLARLRETGAVANWNCGIHVHIGLEAWGEGIVLPLIDSALKYQYVLQTLLQTADYRLIFAPPLTEDMHKRFVVSRSAQDLRHTGRPQSHRCGINLRSWYELGTVEFRFANGTLEFSQIEQTIELYLRFVAAIGAGRELPRDPCEFAESLGAANAGYPPPQTVPQWYRERIWLENKLLPLFQPLVEKEFPGGEILEIVPVADGIAVEGEDQSGKPFFLTFEIAQCGWKIIK